MPTDEPSSTPAELRQALDHLHQENQRLHQENVDLRIALSTTAEHGDLIEADLHSANQRLQLKWLSGCGPRPPSKP
jgi:regulator of replication initiation timing